MVRHREPVSAISGEGKVYRLQRAVHGWMAIAFLFLSILGAEIFRRAGDIPVMLIFVRLTLIYAIEIPTSLL
jgi:hypothetical protein